jgi:hypothetical protein
MAATTANETKIKDDNSILATGATPVVSGVDQFRVGLLAALQPAVESCDANIRRVLESQDALGGHIERLTAGTRFCSHSFTLISL